MKPSQIKSPARLRVLEFVRKAYDEDFPFEFQGNKNAADIFIRNMRTELSRLRKLAEAHGRTPAPFTMKVISMEEFENSNGGSKVKTKIILRKIKNNRVLIAEEVSQVFDNISISEGGQNNG